MVARAQVAADFFVVQLYSSCGWLEYDLSDVVNPVQNNTKRSARMHMHPNVANNKDVNEGRVILFVGETECVAIAKSY